MIRRIITMLLLLSILTGDVAFAANNTDNEKKEMTLEDKVSYASTLLSQIMQDQYDSKVNEIKDIIQKNDYDYTYSMESFLEYGNPFREMDYIKLLATYSTLKHKLAENNKEDSVDLKAIKFIDYDYEIEEFGEGVPYKIEEYEAVNESEDLYEKVGYRYSDEEEEIGVYEEIEDGLYKKTGTKKVKPEQRARKYMDITMHSLTPEDLYKITGIEKTAEIEDDIKRRELILSGQISNDALKSGLMLKLPDELVDMNEWTSKFLDVIGYESDDVPIRVDGASVVGIASLLEGQIPYEWGGKSSKPGYDTRWWSYNYTNGLQRGLDCSGFVQWVYRTAGFSDDIVNTLLSTHIMDDNYEAIDRADIRPGDIGLNMTRKIGHCGIYAGNGKWWHCSSSAGTVTLEDGEKLGFHKIIRPVDLENEYVYRTISVYYPGNEESSITEIKDEKTDYSETVKAEAEDEPEVKEEASTEETTSVPEASTITAATNEPPVNIAADTDSKKESEAVEPKAERQEDTPKVPTDKEPIGTITATGENTQTLVIERPTVSAVNESDVLLLAQLMHHEALNQGLNGWIAVGEVVANRVASPLFPNDYRSVILQKGQFTNSSSLSRIKPDAQMLNAARGIIEGRYKVLNNSNALYFRNAYGKTGNWGRHAVYTKIGNHTFYVQ